MERFAQMPTSPDDCARVQLLNCNWRIDCRPVTSTTLNSTLRPSLLSSLQRHAWLNLKRHAFPAPRAGQTAAFQVKAKRQLAACREARLARRSARAGAGGSIAALVGVEAAEMRNPRLRVRTDGCCGDARAPQVAGATKWACSWKTCCPSRRTRPAPRRRAPPCSSPNAAPFHGCSPASPLPRPTERAATAATLPDRFCASNPNPRPSMRKLEA
eukprot:364759-Chlamydomonas_euryale.AAC.24